MEIQEEFESIGGIFVHPLQTLIKKFKGIKAFVFDWDGVFNNAQKNENKSSTFNEADSMGTNLIRYDYYSQFGKMPNTAIISGEKNEMAFHFCNREHFDASFFKIPNKVIALNHFCETYQLKPSEICYFFDDVLDLSVAEIVGFRIMINRKANPLFRNYVIKNDLADYVTGHDSGNFAVREACELLMGMTGNYDKIMLERTKFGANYQEYINLRQTLPTSFFTINSEEIQKVVF
jgi:3-deoxy-D-manno-octulosonate 8-phosphate phosphatase (KDO 8-P phosphatase)